MPTCNQPSSASVRWRAGIVLDWHTVECQVIGENEFGHPIFDTQRSEIGELLYQFKYCEDRTALAELLRLCNDQLVRHASGRFEVVLPVPPSSPTRTVTRRIARGIAAGLGLRCSDTALRKVKNTRELKSVADPEVRKELLRDAFRVDRKQVEGKAVLLVDDVYRSGATLEQLLGACSRDVIEYLNKKIGLEKRARAAASP